jgi:hypothetical protein
MRIGKAWKLAAEEIVDGEYRTFLKMQDLARNTIGVDHIAAALHKDVAGQCFE